MENDLEKRMLDVLTRRAVAGYPGPTGEWEVRNLFPRDFKSTEDLRKYLENLAKRGKIKIHKVEHDMLVVDEVVIPRK